MAINSDRLFPNSGAHGCSCVACANGIATAHTIATAPTQPPADDNPGPYPYTCPNCHTSFINSHACATDPDYFARPPRTYGESRTNWPAGTRVES